MWRHSTWKHRKRWATDTLAIEFPPVSRSRLRTWEPDPPDDWPREGGVQVEASVVRGYRETVEQLADGSMKSDRCIALDPKRCHDRAYILEAHGFDPAEWEIVTSRHSEWEVIRKGDGTDTLYASRLTVRPLVPTLDLDALVAALSGVEAVTVSAQASPAGGLMELDYFDMHFGVADLAHFTPSLNAGVTLLRDRKPERVLLPVGSDLFHNDNFRATTAKGTPIDGMDFPTAYEGALAFFSTLIEEALALGAAVHVAYVKGNHDESMAWAFCHLLRAKYPQAVVDLGIEERKLHVYGQVAIGLTHGDKAARELDRVFLAEFPEFARASVKEIHAGHIHHEQVHDRYGVMVRRLSTASRTDQWSRDNGFLGANKRFMAFEYAPDSLRAIFYL